MVASRIMTKNPVFVTLDIYIYIYIYICRQSRCCRKWLVEWRNVQSKEVPLLLQWKRLDVCGEMILVLFMHLWRRSEKGCSNLLYQLSSWKILRVQPSDSVLFATERMHELDVNSARVTVGRRILGILRFLVRVYNQ